MKTKVWICLLAALFIFCAVLGVILLRPGEDASAVEVWSDGKLLYTLSLWQEREVTVESANGTNVITVRNGKVAVTEADCPDHYCMDRGFCSGGAQIVCLPNRLVLKFVGQQSIDGVVG